MTTLITRDQMRPGQIVARGTALAAPATNKEATA